MIGRIIRTLAGVGVVGLLLTIIISSVTAKPNYAEKVWDARTTLGDAATAQHHFIMYTDIMCPYCDVISRLMMDNEDTFRSEYVEAQNVVFEVRLTDFLYEYGAHSTNNSREGAEAAYCARNQDRFWDYYHAALKSLWDNYQSKGLGASSTSDPIGDDTLTDSYWLGIGRSIGLGEDFENCYKNHDTLTEIQNNTAKAAKTVDSGLPYLILDRYTMNGFDTSWGWDELKQQFDAGLKS